MCKKQICFCLALVLGVAFNGYAGVIGNWEDTSGDGWQGWTTDNNSIGPLPKTLTTNITYSQATIGHTLGSSTLEVSGVTSNIQCLAIALNAAQRADFMANNKFSIDYTVAAGTTGGWNEIYNIALNAPGYGWHDQFTTAPAKHFDFWSGSAQRTETVTFDYTAAKASITPNPSYIQIILSLNSGTGTSSHEFYFDNARLESSPVLTIKKCTVTAGKTQAWDDTDYSNMTDAFTASGTISVFPSDPNTISHIDVNIVSADGNSVFFEPIDFNYAHDVKSNKFTHKYKIDKNNPAGGAITSMVIDFKKKTFAISATNLDLTGLYCPLELSISLGDFVLSDDVNEAIVNGPKTTIPTRLMRMYKDTLVVNKAKAKHSASSDTLSVTGDIAVIDTDVNLCSKDVNFVWGGQMFSVPPSSFKASKTGHLFKCSKVVADANGNTGLVTAQVDTDKATFTLSVTGADAIDTTSGSIPFGISFADFNETVPVNSVTGRSW